MTSQIENGGTSARLTVASTGVAYLDRLLRQVFAEPVDTGLKFYEHPSGRVIVDPEPHADVSREIWWTSGQPDASFDEAELFDWCDHRDDFPHRLRSLYLIDVPIDPELQARFGASRNVLAVRHGLAARTVVSFADYPPVAAGVVRLQTASDLMAA
jgi:hypothetical protein